ncbi:MAG: hypothetical protein K6G52_08750, partial [Treponemataceae bacterium]|nr:hypothetical protein [Treponemataceae bacterium]
KTILKISDYLLFKKLHLYLESNLELQCCKKCHNKKFKADSRSIRNEVSSVRSAATSEPAIV